jgi:DNA-3-methyladenine glycosylase I
VDHRPAQARGAARGVRGFDPERVAELDVEPLLDDARLIRSGPKLRACVTNARATLALREHGGLPRCCGAPPRCRHRPTTPGRRPASTPASAALAKRLKRAGFVFVGPTTVYSLLQACGLVDDHLTTCPVRDEVEELRAALTVPC